MKEIVEKIKALSAAFVTDAEKQMAGNKAAGARARKAVLEIGKLGKEFRKASMAQEKKK